MSQIDVKSARQLESDSGHASREAPLAVLQDQDGPPEIRFDHPYMIERGISAETLIEFNAGYCENGLMANRVVVPIHSSEGQLIGYAGRYAGTAVDGSSKYIYSRGVCRSLTVFNLHRAKTQSGPLIIVQGLFDALRLYQLGHPKVVALMGNCLSSAQEALISQCTSRRDQILVMLDEDDAGRVNRSEIAARIARFAFVRIHTFEKDGSGPEQLTVDQLWPLFA